VSWDYAHGWATGSPRVLMTDCWLQNAGDAAIAVATQRMIRRYAPDAAVLHAAYGAEVVGGRYPELALVPPLDALLGTRWAAPDRASGIDGPALVGDADLVISQGGGFLREGYRPWSRIDALLRATDLVGSVALLGQTIGVFNTAFGRQALGEVLRRSSAVLVRDSNSRSSAVELGADPALVHLGTDFSLDMVQGAALDPVGGSIPPSSSGQGIGVVLSDHVVPGESGGRAEAAARFLTAVVERSGSKPVIVWSSSQGIPRDSEDDVVAHTAANRLPARHRARVKVVDGHLDAYDLYRWSGAFPSLVSMRFHPALLAAAQGIPSVLAMSDPKVAFFDGAPMRDRVVVGHDVASAERAAGLAIPPPQSSDGLTLLGPVLERLSVNRQVIADLLAGTR
jgi:polysaccharide pyruvyl transferase WcaK-like protein